ncbi:hypothetical protein GE061_000084 [Apolygus lucorum]|uniref:Peptidase A1 domain-containing protein n=1 Tax=Apolygus lucorum TaxID=248454 RepID=A0A8S9Y5A3_APOLU|nr:hypothetical protein GE061_000084 [Apolygus lucorum]
MNIILGTALLAASALTIDALVRIPIEKRSSSSLKRRPWSLGAGNVTLTNNDEVFYSGEVCIGTPPQCFMLDFDTGSSDLWVVSKYCNMGDPGCRVYLKNHLPTYDHKASSTYVKNGNPVFEQYGSGWYKGHESIDTFSIGGLRIEDQTFGEAIDLAVMGIQGLVGLAWRSLEVEDGVMPFSNIFKQYQLPHLFSFYLSSDLTGRGGEIIIGGIDESLVDKDAIKYAPVLTRHGFWELSFTKATFGSNILDVDTAVMDTGTTDIYADFASFSTILSAVKAYSNAQGNYVDCKTYKSLPDLTVQFGEIEMTIGPEDYISTTWTPGKCALTILPGDSWIIGDICLRKYYQVYDYANARFGAGPLKKSPRAS